MRKEISVSKDKVFKKDLSNMKILNKFSNENLVFMGWKLEFKIIESIKKLLIFEWMLYFVWKEYEKTSNKSIDHYYNRL